MRSTRLIAACAALAASSWLASTDIADAQSSDNALKIGVINDMAGPYEAIAGKGSVVAAQMAIEDFGGTVLGRPITLLTADHQLKPEVGVGIIKKWFDIEGVDMVADLVHSSIALAAEPIANEKDRVLIATAVGAVDFTGKGCTPNSVSWLYDTQALTVGLVQSLVEQHLDTWYLIVVDYAFGSSMEADARKAIEASGGKVLGAIRHPLGTNDFSSYLLQAQQSGAKVVLIANGGSDLINAIKQAKEFGLDRTQKIVSPLMFITDVKSLGLKTAQGLSMTTAFYWDRNDETRAWSKRFFERHKAMPTMAQASLYSAVLHYLKAVAAAGTDEGRAVVAKMRELPVNDVYVKNGKLRVDGRLMHPMYLVKIKSPAESHGEWDLYDIIGEIPAEKAFAPLSESGCPLARQ
jgi:branched-chain amino acid transport system substrate-binding protein